MKPSNYTPSLQGSTKFLWLSSTENSELNFQSQIYIVTDCQSISKFWQLRSSSRGEPSLTRGLVCVLCMLLDLTGVVFLGSKSLGTRDHISLSQIWDFPFRRLLRLAGSRWMYPTPLPHRWQNWNIALFVFKINPLHGLNGKHRVPLLWCMFIAALPDDWLSISLCFCSAPTA
jgi:hypothetical protein